MKICVYGAGAIGGSLAARLHGAGAEVSVVARGEHGRAIQRSGLTLLTPSERICVLVRCVDALDELPAQDLVIVTVKGPSLAGIAGALARAQGQGARLAFVMNGIPWWFVEGLDTSFPDSVREQLDPGGCFNRAFATDRIVWGVVYSSNEVVAPGVVQNTTTKNRLVVGRPDGAMDAWTRGFADLLMRAGYDARASGAIRHEIWMKMLVVAGVTPVSALTGASLQDLVDDQGTRQLMATLMREVVAAGRALGFPIADDIEERLAYYRAAPLPVRPSMLQDFDLGREPEIENGILAVNAIAQSLGLDVPVMDVFATLVRARKKFMAPSRVVAGSTGPDR